MTQLVAIYVYPDVEVLDFAGPYEVFTTASRVHGRTHAGAPERFRVITVASVVQPVRARAGLTVFPDCSIVNCPQPDVLLVPGGVVDAELGNAELMNWLAHAGPRASVTASVCTGSFLLAKAGLLAGRKVTTHWEDSDDLRRMFPDLDVVDAVRWVDQGNIVTSAGIAAGIDMSLHLVARLAGEALAMATARQMEVPFVVSS